MAAIAALAIGLGTWIGTEIGQKRTADRAKRAQEAGQRERDAAEAADAAEARRERRAEALDDAVEDANGELLRAAKAGRRDAVARQEAGLDQLARRQDAAGTADQTSKDPFEHELERFPIKQPPLVAQQISSTDDDHVLFVSVHAAHFCLKSRTQRRQAIRVTHTPIATRLRSAGIDDFKLLVVPFGNRAPTRSQALAIAGRHGVAVTSRGRSC